MKLAQLRAKPPIARRVMGIDASTQAIAFTVFYNRRPVKWGKFYLEGKDIYEKAADAQRKTRSLMLIYEVDYCAIESAVFVNSRDTVIKLAYIFGAIISTMVLAGVRVIDVQPTVWQNYIGNGRVSPAEKAALRKQFPKRSKSWYANELRKRRKQKTINYFNAKFKMHLSDDDVADSCGIGYYAYMVLTRRR